MKELILMLILLMINLLMNFKSFMYNTVAQPAPNAVNRILKNATIAVPIKYLRNFWRSIKMPLINWGV